MTPSGNDIAEDVAPRAIFSPGLGDGNEYEMQIHELKEQNQQLARDLEKSQLQEDETAASARARDFYEKLAKPGRYAPIAFEADAKPAEEEAIVCYALAALAVDASKLPKGVDASRRERHLSPDAFRAAFGVGATAFSAWPKWRQALAKRKVGLY